ncbi:pyruvate dehydrogenase complex dihydrolipoamide acetyltransferase component (E2) [Linnemannia hyalina]|uniref:Pyruvate dehydrogenase complex dihydrolipoamide acetyltransferase component (E2) n=1 Tax=Linnemannia hyalina TaxID=64524 RepID=A0A9P7XQS6_9FUNG|nr:pyruvate dehydrogenase complex dihydrolipoamide acetyltransferase component (E2) [Linnemannia hyalina]
MAMGNIGTWQKKSGDAISAGAAYADAPVTNMRKIIARRLTKSKQTVPRYYVTVEMEMEKIMKLREVLSKSSEETYKLSVNDFIVKASAFALKVIPRGQQLVDERLYQLVPHFGHLRCYLGPHWIDHPHCRQRRDIIPNQVKDLASRASAIKLSPTSARASCILAVGATEKRVVPGAEGGEHRTASIMAVTLNPGHRTVDGAVSAQFLKAFKGYMETPLKILL